MAAYVTRKPEQDTLDVITALCQYWGTMLEAGMSQFRVPMRCIFF
jgi:hypothetical protein